MSGDGKKIPPWALFVGLMGMFGVWMLLGNSVMVVEMDKRGGGIGCVSEECHGTNMAGAEAFPGYKEVGVPLGIVDGGKVERMKWNESCESWFYRGALDSRWYRWPDSPSVTSRDSGRVEGAFVMLARRKNVGDLKQSIARLSRYYLSRFDARVLIFHDDLGEKEIRQTREVAGEWSGVLEFHEVRFCVPKFLGFDPPQYVGESPVNYRHMMRFFAISVFSHPALSMGRFSHYARLDADSLLGAPVSEDFFEELSRRQGAYGFTMLWKDDKRFIGGLTEEVEKWMGEEGLEAKGGVVWEVFRGEGVEVSGVQFWNNFEVVDLKFVNSKYYRNFLNHVDRKGLMYSIRLGDALIRSIAVAVLLEPDQIVQFHIAYQHQTQFRCPLDVVEGGNGERVKRPFVEYSAGEVNGESEEILPGSARSTACDVSDSLELIRDRCNSKKTNPATNLQYCSLTRRAPCSLPRDTKVAKDAWNANDVPAKLCNYFFSREI